MTAEERLSELGIELPAPPTPMASYVPAVRTGSLLWIAGQPPGPGWRGHVGREYSVEQGQQAARAAGLNILAQVRKATGSLDRVVKVV
ncbi:MAG: RidA family protein, partial [Actinobacteria bacterium]|nr:RidA family protein [Actinomycetota bacterium]